MKVPIAWLREYVSLPDDPQVVADRLAMLGFPIDGVETRPTITGVVVGKIVALEKHPNADRLQVGKIDIGSDKQLTIATAATNVAVGQTIPVAIIGAQLPKLTITPRKMRGVDSEGMMVSADELALPAEWFEDGIMQLDSDIPLGTNVVDFFRLGDAVLDVDITPNRPDALSMIGIARELAAALGAPIRVPLFDNPGKQTDAKDDAPVVTIESPDCTRFVAQRFTGARIGPAPAWMRIRLALAGQRPINNLVDISNYVMLEVGQPLHFYDDAKIQHHHLIVRDAKPGEKLVTLDDVEHELTPQALVIADENAAQGLAGLKGGKFAEISGATTTVLLESANFNGPRIRRMSLALGLRTDASTRHEKTLAPAMTDIGAARAAQLLVQLGATAFEPHAFGTNIVAQSPIEFHIGDVKRILGYALSADDVARHLEALGCAVSRNGQADVLQVTPPPWRRDITIPVDLVEEIARMAGYDTIVAEMPATAAQNISSDTFDLEQRLAHRVAGLGYLEVITYSLHGAAIFEKLHNSGMISSYLSTELNHPKIAEQNPRPTDGEVKVETPAGKTVAVDPAGRRTVEVANPLSEDQRYLRHSLVPGLLEYFSHTGKPVRAFEIGHVFGYNDDHKPEEHPQLTFGFSVPIPDEPEWSDSNFLRIKGDVYALVREMTGLYPDEVVRDIREGLHPGKTAGAFLGGREVATFGRLDPRFAKVYDLSFAVYVATIHLNALPEYATPRYIPPSKFPSTYRDISLTLPPDVPAATVERTIAMTLGDLCTGVHVFDEYRGPQIGPDQKSLAVRVTLQRTDTTITDEEADGAMAGALDARTTLKATVRT